MVKYTVYKYNEFANDNDFRKSLPIIKINLYCDLVVVFETV